MIDRSRITERVSVSTLKLELRRAIQPLIVLAVGFAAALVAGYYIVNSINGGTGSTHQMRFEVADATGVVPGRAEVRFYGIQAGTIDSAQLVNGHAVLTVSVAEKYGPVYKNAVAAVRPNTPLNDMYLDITSRGTPGAGIAGPDYVVPISQTQSPTNLADVLNAFQPDIRTQLYNLIDQLGNGLQNRGADLRQAFMLVAPFLKIAGNVSEQLAVRADLTRQLVHNAALLSGVLASRSDQLHHLITNGTSTLEALSAEGGAPLKKTIEMLPPMIATTDNLWHNVFRTFPPLITAINDLKPVADELPQGLTNLRALGVSANPAVLSLENPVRRLVPLADSLRPFASNLSGALTEIKPQIPDVQQATTALADCSKDIQEFFNWDASMSKWINDQGPMVRGNANFGFYTAPLVKDQSFTYRPQCAPGNPIGYQPVPKLKGPPPQP